MSKVATTTVVRDYESGGQFITVNGHNRYCKYYVTQTLDSGETITGFDEVWFGLNGEVVAINTHDGLVRKY